MQKLIKHILRLIILFILLIPIYWLYNSIDNEKELVFNFIISILYGLIPGAYILHFIELYWRKAKRYKLVISLVKVGK